MKKATSEQVFEKLQAQLKKNRNGAIKFELSGFEIIVKQNNVVGNILEEWLDKWMTEMGFSHDYNHAQSAPDFWLDIDNHDTEWLEIKAFTGSPNFDIANMMSYITEVIEKPWKLHSKYLCLKYKMDEDTGIVTVSDVWLKSVWEISCPSAKWAVKVQDKKGVIYNLRPATWYSTSTSYPIFKCLEHFLSALDYVLKTYSPTAKIGMTWRKDVVKAYQKHFGQTLDIPLWQDIAEQYAEKNEK